MNRSVTAFVIAAALTGGSATAAAPAETASYTIGITGFVPVVCHASLDSSVIPAQAGETPLGQLNEFCNSPGGYQLFVESSPELANSTLLVDGRAVPLSADGPTLIVTSDGPSIASRDVSLASNGAGGSLSFRIVSL